VADRDDPSSLDALLRAARALPSGERAAWIAQVCGSDGALRSRLEELLALSDAATEAGGPRTPGFDAPPARPLEPGQRLGRYEVQGLLGFGGMGHVYRAVDTSLGRDVAIKALAHAFHGDAISLRRFEREARVLAALSHPNIATIHGFERLDGAPYLILELVQGETLAQRLRGGRLSLAQTIEVGRQVAAGLEEAHAKGVVHRDLKPSNVMLATGGRVKLVDFGLAKSAHEGEGPGAVLDSVVAEPTTVAGAILGTVPYMSPEQVQGERIDTRTDVWAFGCLLYEMLTGEPAFTGRSVPELLAAVLRDEPRWERLPADLPAPLRRLVLRCLAKDPHARLQHIGDARIELTELAAEPALAAAWPAPPRSFGRSSGRNSGWTAALSDWRRRGAPRWRTLLPWLIAGVALGAVAVLLLRPSTAPEAAASPASRLRLSLDLPTDLALSTAYPPPFALAPAGDAIALVASQGGVDAVFLRPLGDLAVRQLAGTEGGRQPFFSPDGAWLAFFAQRKLVKVPVGGGPPVSLAEIGNNPRGATWSGDGTLVVSPSQTSPLVRIPASGGAPQPLTQLDAAAGEVSHRWPEVVPGTSWVVFTVAFEDATYDEARLDLVSLATGERRRLVDGAGFGRVVPGGPLLFVRGGRLHAVRFDAATLAVLGTPEALADTVRYDLRNGAAHLAVAASGTVLYGPGVPVARDVYLSWLDRRGSLERLVDTPRPFRDPRLSPDGRRVAVVIGSARASDLWLVEAQATMTQLSFGLSPHRPTWTPDGAGVTIGSGGADAWRLLTLPAAGGEPREVLRRPRRAYPNSWAPGGDWLLFQESDPRTGWDLRYVAVGPDGRATGEAQAFAATPFVEANGALSPDGRWVAYESDEVDATVQVYVRAFPGGERKVRASSGGARGPVWSPDGKLYFWDSSRQRITAVTFRPDREGLAVASEEPAVGDDPATTEILRRLTIHTGWGRLDLHPSGERFLTLETAAATLVPPLARPVVVLDWAAKR
jgi:serine/threonine protein kinase/Tol biopolymer transport system component